MKIGIVGGISPESTVDYYKGIVDAYQKHRNDGSFPSIVIESIDLTEMIGYVSAGQWDRLVHMLVAALKNLAAAGADFAIIASNTPHIVFDRVKTLSPLPLLSIVEETCKKAKELHYNKVGLLGTSFTMKEPFYRDCFAVKGIEIVVPRDEEQLYIHEKIFAELVFGVVREDTREKFLAIVGRMVEEQKIEALILGCTELPLILKDDECQISLLNTVAIHVESVISELKL